MECKHSYVFRLLLTALLYSLSQASGGKLHWSYSGSLTNPNHWWLVGHPVCGSDKQSPIQLNTHRAQYDRQLRMINIFTNADTVPLTEMVNNGHTVKLTFPANTWFVSLSGTMEMEYEVAQLHFHWGGSIHFGSEHKLNSDSFPIETHLVTFNKKYKSVAEAMTKSDGLAVLGFWHKVNRTETSSIINSIEPLLSSVETPGQKVSVSNADLRQWFKEVDKTAYFRYDGSLTTPPCTENVKWTIFVTPMPITRRQLSSFRTLTYGSEEIAKKMMNNFRPIQKLNGRVVRRSWKLKNER